ncbi:MAG: hypothetical protein GX793_01620 [Bacteroidales bacterium]|jgi:hypothetical protein|nr:hypothetical protein [Bacteroidales bacterium]
MNEEHISKAIRNQFKFKLENESGKTVRVALIPAYLQKMNVITEDKDVVISKEANGDLKTEKIAIVKGITYSSPELLVNKGYPVDVVLADETVAFDDPTKTLIMSASDPSVKIEDFLNYIKTNPTPLKGITIIASNKMAFETSMKVAKLNPFGREKEEQIDLGRFFNKFQNQDDRIDVSFTGSELELSDDLLWTVNVPAGVTMDFSLYF